MSELSPNAAVVVLAYILDRAGGRILMLHHNTDPGDSSYGKYNGLSGRMMKNESVLDTAHRIIRNETQVEPGDMLWRGMVHWSGFGADSHSLLGCVFLVDGLRGLAQSTTSRGRLQWVEIDKLMTNQVPMWPGDEDLLPLVLDPAWVKAIEASLPELPDATYQLWVRGYGLLDSKPIWSHPSDVTARPGQTDVGGR